MDSGRNLVTNRVNHKNVIVILMKIFPQDSNVNDPSTVKARYEVVTSYGGIRTYMIHYHISANKIDTVRYRNIVFLRLVYA